MALTLENNLAINKIIQRNNINDCNIYLENLANLHAGFPGGASN